MRALYAAVLLSAIGFGFLLGHHYGAVQAPSSARRVLYYVSPMNPAYRSDRPGIAPDCGMPLEPVYADDGRPVVASDGATQSVPGAVRIDGERQQLLGIRVVAVEKTGATGTIRVPGTVAADETRLYRVNVGVDGLVRETHGDTVGSYVRKGQRLAVVYSPEFLSATGGYLSAYQRQQDIDGKGGAAGTPDRLAVQNWAFRLRNMGMSDAQIKELDSTRAVPEGVYVVSPVTGFVLARNILSGQGFERRAEFYRIADLSRVWIVADLFGSEARYVHPGTIARITSADLRRSFSARVSDSLPQIDPSTRALKLRLEAENGDFALRPGTLVQVDLTVPLPSGLSVPADAVLDSGLATRVFVDRGNGLLEPRQVEVGERFGDRVQILSGLAEGDQVVDSGTFLVDSESRLRTAAASAQQPALQRTGDDGCSGSLVLARCDASRSSPDGTIQSPSATMRLPLGSGKRTR